MKSWLSSVVGALYLSVTLFFGFVHHHDHAAKAPAPTHEDCSACTWQHNAVTDVPVALPLVDAPIVQTPIEVFDFVSYSAPSYSFSASRAPPVTLA